MSQSQENLQTDGKTDRRAEGGKDRPYFIGPFRPRPGVQKRKILVQDHNNKYITTQEFNMLTAKFFVAKLKPGKNIFLIKLNIILYCS